ncbi:conserved unknown protein [Ectocarpus siliculosus]|uniref:Uncharacterized protein n=1 Tax=Ectocarpus siliculosus TaxID=2880 RepID=D8LKR4_ECTSI|nr:conserved unknown protein [Ectocarpus siliculosus]|eukprot:CBN76099.1 conserved unknown protein [Ectocarpus siliculosus]
MANRKRDRSPSPGPDEDHETMRIMPIGAGNEVGRSCVILKYMGKTIMLDCGIHPGYNGIAALPFFDAIDPSEVRGVVGIYTRVFEHPIVHSIDGIHLCVAVLRKNVGA